MPDRIEETLRSLQLDVDRTPLPDSGSVRRQGDRRTRNQVLASAFVTVAFVAAAVGVAGNLAGDRRAVEGPPATDGPTISTSQEPTLALAAAPFLQDGDLTGIGPYGDFQDSGEAPSYQLMQCIDVPALGSLARQTSTVLFEPDIGEPSVHQHALEFASAAAAEEFVTRAGEAFATCDKGDPAEATVTDRGPEAVAAVDGLRGSRETRPTVASDIGYYELGVARESNVVAVLEWTSMGNPGGKKESDWVWVLTPERLRLALDRAVG